MSMTKPTPPAALANAERTEGKPPIPPFRVRYVTNHPLQNPVSLYPDFGGMIGPGMVLEVPERWRHSVMEDFKLLRFQAHGRPFLEITTDSEKTAEDLARELSAKQDAEQKRNSSRSRR